MLSEDILKVVDSWSERGWLRPLDRAFVRFLKEMVPDTAPLTLLAGALASHQLGRGHLCLEIAAALKDPDATLLLPPEGESGEAMPARPSQLLSEISGISRAMWEETLLASSDLVATGSGNTPLVLDNGRLYLRRYWQYTTEVAEELLSRLDISFSIPDNLSERLDELFSPLRVEDEESKRAIHWQSVATAIAAKSGFSIISGGPGTGKTTTVVQILALLQGLALEQSKKLRIHLAAPTGKAAARLTESIGSAVGRLPDHIREALPTQVTTLHRLLGSRPGTRHFIHTRSNQLSLDLLVVDEASMVDLEMMAALLAALPKRARLILLGDKDQLASVEAGLVLGDLCRNADREGYNDQTCQWIERYTGYSVQKSQYNCHALTGTTKDESCRDASCRDARSCVSTGYSPVCLPTFFHIKKKEPISSPEYFQRGVGGSLLDQHIVVLRKSHRFGDQSGIGALARAVNSGDPEAAEAVWKQGFKDISSISVETTDDRAFASLVVDSGYRSYLKIVSDGPGKITASGNGQDSSREEVDMQNQGTLEDLNRQRKDGERQWEDGDRQKDGKEEPDEQENLWIRSVMSEFARFQLLTPLRKGPWGVEGLNKKTAELLHREGLILSTHGWYPGRPVMVLSNDYSLGLMNGDVGILLPLMGSLKVVFPMPDRSFKKVLPSRLNNVETVYAMTVHKSQGSEFDHTAMVLPDTMTPLLTRELIYTGITRAKSFFTLVTPETNLLGEAVRRRTHRASGLGDILHST